MVHKTPGFCIAQPGDPQFSNFVSGENHNARQVIMPINNINCSQMVILIKMDGNVKEI